MEGKGSFFILLIIIAILSLSLAVLAGYVFFAADHPKAAADAAAATSDVRPPDKELGRKLLFEQKQFYNLKSVSDNKMSVIQVEIELIYFKGKKEAEVVEKLKMHDSEIKELVCSYFQNRTLEEVKQADTKEKAKKELKDQFNKLLTAGDKEKKEVIYSIVFKEWFYQ